MQRSRTSDRQQQQQLLLKRLQTRCLSVFVFCLAAQRVLHTFCFMPLAESRLGLALDLGPGPSYSIFPYSVHLPGLLSVISARIKGIKRREKAALAQHTSRVNTQHHHSKCTVRWRRQTFSFCYIRRQISEGYEEYTQLELTAVGPVNCESVEKENLQIDVDVDTTLWGSYEPAEPGADPSSKK